MNSRIESFSTPILRRQPSPIGLLGGVCVFVSSTAFFGKSHPFLYSIDRKTLSVERIPSSSGLGPDSMREVQEATQPSLFLGDQTSPPSNILAFEGAGAMDLAVPKFTIHDLTSEKVPEPVCQVQLTISKDDTASLAGPVGERPMFEVLRGLEEYSEDNWDLEGARAITSMVISLAGSVLQRIPESAALPEVAPAADGSVCMEWVTPAGLLWVDVGSDRAAWILKRIDGKLEEKRLPVDGKDFTSYLQTSLESLYPPEPRMAADCQTILQ